MDHLVLERISVRSFRNLRALDLAPVPRLNVISGDNGHGKTSLLEAIYFVATSKSFRTSKLGEVLAHEQRVASVRARFVELPAGLPREQTAGIEGRRSTVMIDGNKSPSLHAYATRSPVVAFHADELALSTGPASARRTLLDRLALYTDPVSADHRARYAHAVRARQLLLQASRGDAQEIGAFEQLCAHHGAHLTRARRRAAEALEGELFTAFARIAAPNLRLEPRYAPGGSEDEDRARAELERQRRADAHRKSAAFGPHRDDLELYLDAHPARAVASQGQHRAITLAIKAAETACIAAVRGVEPILLLDDVSSELDPARTHALLSFLAHARGQIFITTTRPELIPTPGVDAADRRDWRLCSGALEATSSALPTTGE